MGYKMGLLKKIGNLFPGTGRHAARRAERASNQAAAEAKAEAEALKQKTKKEKEKAQRLAIRGLRSRRAASRFTAAAEGNPSYGSPTIG